MSDTRIAAYQGATIGTLTLVERNDDDALGEPRSRVALDATAGVTYRIQVGDAPGAPAGPLLLRWYAAPPDPPQLCTPDAASFTTNPSLETDAAGWGATAASASAGDTFQRYVGDGANGGACAEIALSGGVGTGLAYTDAAPRSWHVAATVSVWLRVVGGTPRPVALAASVNGQRLVPIGGGADPVVTPSGAWQAYAVQYEALEQTGPLVISASCIAAGAAMVLRADCLQGVATPAPPDPPTSLACAPSQTAIRLSWAATPGADGYYVRRDGVLVGTVTTPGFTDSPLAPGTTHAYAVSAFSTAGGESSATLLTCATTPDAGFFPLNQSCDALGFLELDGVEVANQSRTAAYLRNRLGGPGWTIRGDPCSILEREAGLSLVDPAIDPAPWYDAARPESGDFLGAWAKVQVVRHSTRSVTPRTGTLGGADIGQLRPGAYEINVVCALVARSSRGADYGRRWLENRLRRVGGGDPCDLGTARLRLACPEPGDPDTLGEVFLYDVALVGDVTQGTPISLSSQCCALDEVSFTLTAGQAGVYHRTSFCAQGSINHDPGTCIPFCDWWRGPDDGSYSTSVGCSVDSPNLFGAVGVIATISADAQPVSGVEIALYPPGTACPPPGGTTPTGVVHIGSPSQPSLPAGSVLVYDSARRILTFYANAADASSGANPHPGIGYVTVPDGQSVPWIEATPDQPATCLVVGKRGWCGGSATVRIDTQLREA